MGEDTGMLLRRRAGGRSRSVSDGCRRDCVRPWRDRSRPRPRPGRDPVRGDRATELSGPLLALRGHRLRVDRSWKDPNALVERLLEFGRAQPQPPVFYYDGDADLLLVSRHRAQLREAFRFVVPEAELVEALVDKARFQALAERLELPVPRAQHLTTLSGPVNTIDLRSRSWSSRSRAAGRGGSQWPS
jgi:hypothetical protein